MPPRARANPETQQWWDEFERLSRMLGQVGPDEVCCDGLSQRQCSILRTLVAQEGARISDLAASSGITPSAMTRVLEKLEARTLVERVRGTQADGRAATVKITAAGRKVREQLDELMRERTRTIIDTIPVKQRAHILSSLQLLNNVIASSGCCGLNQPVQSSELVSEIGFGKSMFRNANRSTQVEPRSGVRVQPTAQAVGRK